MAHRAQWTAALLLSLASCAVGPDFVRPEAPAVDHFTDGADSAATVEAAGQAQLLLRGGDVVGDWWKLFGSPQLDAVMKQAVDDNQSLKAALAALQASQSNLQAGYGIFYPQVDAGASATRQRSLVAAPSASGSTPFVFNLFTVSASVSYAVDIFGGKRRAVEGLQAQADFQQYTAVAAYLSLTGNVVNTVIARAAYAEQAAATEDLVRDQREQVDITEAQAKAGIVTYASALSLRSQLASAEATVPPLRQKVSQAQHLLSTLAGRLPSEWAAPPVAFSELTLPERVPVSVPSELIRQRPDILAAESQLHQASAAIGVATAAMYPSLNLTATFGTGSTGLDGLFLPGAALWSIGAGLTAPLFHGGELWNKRQAAIHGYDQALANYRQTVLSAFAQVADSLRALEHDAEQLDAQRRAMNAADEALRLIRANYSAGVANYVQVLVAFGQYHQARIAFIQAQAQRLQDTVALFLAMGGGWWDQERTLLGRSPAAH